MNAWEYVMDAVVSTVALFGVLGATFVVLAVIGILLSNKEGNDND